jgi:hypothetical protein
MAASNEVRSRFAEYVKIQALGDNYIDRRTERKILEQGVLRFELSLDDARQIMNTVAASGGTIFETDCDKRIKDILSGFNDVGKIGPREFACAVAIFRRLCNNALSELEIRAKVKRVMTNRGYVPKRAGFFFSRRWFSRIAMLPA